MTSGRPGLPATGQRQQALVLTLSPSYSSVGMSDPLEGSLTMKVDWSVSNALISSRGEHCIEFVTRWY